MNAVPYAKTTLEAWLREGALLDLGARAGAARCSARAGIREDGAVLLADAAREWAPTGAAGAARELHLLDPSEDRVRELRRLHPDLWIHAEALPGLDPEGALRLARAGVDSLGVATGPAEVEEGPWCALLDLPLKLVACATYGPGTPPEALAARLERLGRASGLTTLVWLPYFPGDESFQPGHATDGLRDAVLVAASRLYLPGRVRLRSSWAAWGWKMGQFLLTCGADEVAGWGLEEERSWGREARPAAILGRLEAEAGVREAGRVPVEVRGCAWES